MIIVCYGGGSHKVTQTYIAPVSDGGMFLWMNMSIEHSG